MGWFNLKTLERRIALIGSRNSGKSVFLTSLIQHLSHHQPARFPIGSDGQAEIKLFKEIPNEKDWPEFPFERFSSYLAENTWLEKSTDRSMYSATFERTDWYLSNCELRLLDLPGERFLDIDMVRAKELSYASWSDGVWKRLISTPQSEEESRTFRNGLTEFEDTQEVPILCSYKQLLNELRIRYRPSFTPSIFYLDQQGKKLPKEISKEELYARPLGLDLERQFMPLSKESRARYPLLTERFEKRFQEYCQSLVMPVLSELRRCTSIIYLIDIQTILMSGDDVYNDEHHLLSHFVEALDPKFGFWENLATMVRSVPIMDKLMKNNWVQRVAFVCPKIDHVHADDRDHLMSLLQSFTEVASKKLRDRGIEVEHFTVAAVNTTRSNKNGTERVLEGVPFRSTTGELVQVPVSEVPAEWPPRFQAGHYKFPIFNPNYPKTKGQLPKMIDLNKVFQFVSY